RLEWKYVGVLHEYLDCSGRMCVKYDDGNYHIVCGHIGDRSKNPNKYLDDAIVLEKAFKEEQNGGLKNRYAYYCAQSYNCHRSVNPEYTHKAIEWYKICLSLDGWVQEKY